ncbi:MAG TPA: hypothetical protein VM327_07600 [Candidatus Thermoplasmatota archaeon]|nr:hypothetical protein [Candidatus Thermoplasmatota archaeon]
MAAHGVPGVLPGAIASPTANPEAQPAPLTIVAAPPATVRDPSGVLPGLPWEASGGLEFSTGGTPWRVLLINGAPAPEGLFVSSSADAAPCAPESAQEQAPCPVKFWCPSLDGGTTVTDGTNTMTIRVACPYRIADDADLLGSPQIAVNADDPNSIAFFSLHGGGSTEGPTPRSRDPSPEGLTSVTGLSHTTFTSQDHGRSWHDNPWGTDGFGENAAGTMDHDGNLYISALWSKRLGEGRFNYVIKLYKEQDGRYTIATYQPSKTFSNRADGNTISGADIVFVSAPRIEPVNASGNQTGNATAPADEGDVGNYTNGESFGTENSPDDRVMAVWFEQALDWGNSTTGKSSWIDAAWTDTSPKDNWTRLADDQLIGPCMAASNPVAYDGKAYVACVADAGYNGRSRAHIGDVDVWSIDPMTGKTTLEESTGLEGGQPRMASRPDGYMAIASVAVKDESNIAAQVAFGWYGQHWTAIQNAGSQLHDLMGGHKVKEARVTSMALTQEKNTLFLTYMERVNTEGEIPEANPSALNADPSQAIEYRKVVTTFSQCSNGAMDAYDLQTGVARHPFNDEVIGDQTGVFDDLQDGMQFWRDPDSGEERIYFAYGDHGVIQFGALVGGASADPCPITAPPPSLPPPPIPAALSTASPYSMMVGATVGATALAMVTYLLAAKKRTLTFATAKDKRK